MWKSAIIRMQKTVSDLGLCRILALNLLRFHADFCDLISDWMCAYALGNFDRACELCELARKELGKRESEFERFYDHYLYFTEYYWTLNYKNYVKDSAIII